MTEGTSFQPVLDDPSISDATISSVERVVFLSGKMYYDLIKLRSEKGLNDKIAFVRLEVCLFPSLSLSHSRLLTRALADP